MAPDLYERVELGHSNDGDGLSDEDSTELAKQLRQEIDSGRTAAYEVTREATLDALPDVQCPSCNGAGTRMLESDAVAVAQLCQNCGGKGRCRPFAAFGGFDVENVERFVAFLEGCGGFEIW